MNKKQIICLWAFLMALSVHSQTMEQAWKECARRSRLRKQVFRIVLSLLPTSAQERILLMNLVMKPLIRLFYHVASVEVVELWFRQENFM